MSGQAVPLVCVLCRVAPLRRALIHIYERQSSRVGCAGLLEGGTGVLYGGVRCCCVSHTGTTIECAVARVWHVTTYCGIHAIAARPARLVTRMQPPYRFALYTA